jgi:uridine kinase
VSSLPTGARDVPVLQWLVDEICRRKQTGRPIKVGIDGRCASGKTTLADTLAPLVRGRGLDVLRPSVDSFHHPRAYRYRQGEYSAIGYYEDAFDYGAIVAHLLKPLSGDEFPAVCRHASHDVRTDVATDASIRVSAQTVLLFDGVFLFRRELDAYWDFRILVHVDAGTSIARAVERDFDGTGEVEIIRRKYEQRYEPAWLIYRDFEQPERKAHVIIDNENFAQARFLKGGFVT